MPPAVTQGEVTGRPLVGAARPAFFVHGAHFTVCGLEVCDLLRSPVSIHFVAGVCLALYSRRCDLIYGLNVGFSTRTPFTTVRPIMSSRHALQS